MMKLNFDFVLGTVEEVPSVVLESCLSLSSGMSVKKALLSCSFLSGRSVLPLEAPLRDIILLRILRQEVAYFRA